MPTITIVISFILTTLTFIIAYRFNILIYLITFLVIIYIIIFLIDWFNSKKLN